MKDIKNIEKTKTSISLLDYGIANTPVRLLILETLLKSNFPLSLIEIETILETVDRSSISRTLSLFKKKNLIHSINDGSGAVRYEICTSGDHKEEDLHVHFHCRICGHTFCFQEISVPEVVLPDGFHQESINYVMEGVCKNCLIKK